MPAEEVELLVWVEARLSAIHALLGADTPWAEQRRNPSRPRPLPHPVEPFAVRDVMAVPELLVPEQVPVRLHDPLGEAGRPRGVVELRGVVGGRIDADMVSRRAAERAGVEHERLREPPGVRGVGDEELCARVVEAVRDAVVPVQNGHREEDRTELPDAKEESRSLGRRRQHDRNPVAAAYTLCGEYVRRLVGKVLKLAPCKFPARPVEALPNHRGLPPRVLAQTSAAML